jgi:hypothetical protein
LGYKGEGVVVVVELGRGVAGRWRQRGAGPNGEEEVNLAIHEGKFVYRTPLVCGLV